MDSCVDEAFQSVEGWNQEFGNPNLDPNDPDYIEDNPNLNGEGRVSAGKFGSVLEVQFTVSKIV